MFTANLMMFMINIQLFAGDVGTPVAGTYGVSPLNTTTSEGLTDEMKAFYQKQLLENVRPNLVFNQFGESIPLPSGNGKTVEVRRMETFAKVLTPLVEGKIPTGNSLKVTKKTITVDQYGDYTPITDQLNWAAVDPILAEAVNEHSAQANVSLDTLTRNKVCAECNLDFPGEIDDIDELTIASKITAADVARVATTLKKFNTPKIQGSYVAIIHPSVAYDLRQDSGWVEAHKYSATKEIFNGEIGELHGVRFVESTEAKIEMNSAGLAVYNCIFFGLKAWGVVKPNEMTLRSIIKSAKEVGGPLEQYSTAGWKAMHGAGVLYTERMVNFICASSFSGTDTAN